KYVINKIIYEKQNKLTGIINSIKDNTKYILKIRSNNYHKYETEKNICNLLKNTEIECETIIKFVDFVQRDNYFYFIYEYFEGSNLAEYLTSSNNNNNNNSNNSILSEYEIKLI